MPNPPQPTSARSPARAGANAEPSTDTPAGSPGAEALFGDVRSTGFGFAWNEIDPNADYDWGRGFRPGSLELCLNLEGRASVHDGRRGVDVAPGTGLFYFQAQPPLRATRPAGERHRFVTVAYAVDFLQRHLGSTRNNLHPFVRSVVDGDTRKSAVGEPEPLRAGLRELVESLRRCPVFEGAQEVWFRCKALELASQCFFCPTAGELTCSRPQRLACERAARVREILRGRLVEPPPLKELGRLVGCSPFHLSRQFSESTGLTIQQFLRQARLERAAELLRAGDHNVTEAALEVGYNSLSHFTLAFRETFGCCPGLYPLQPMNRQRADASGPTRPATSVPPL